MKLDRGLRGIALNFLLSIAIVAAAESAAAILAFGLPWLLSRAVWILLLDLAAASSVAALAHLRACGGRASCMASMMLGMVAGMQSGMLAGYVLGATNGFFAGALASTMFGMLVGYLAGRSGTTMGKVQGAMAGFMGGSMGAMTSVMMVGPGFWIFTAWFAAANLLIFWSFHPLVSEEIPSRIGKLMNFWRFLLWTAAASAALFLVLAFGPKGLVF